jgi:hypothetical protein
VRIPCPFAALVCADWSKNAAGRAAYVAVPATRTIERLGGGPWTFEVLLQRVQPPANAGPVLLGMDLPLGVPRSMAGSAEPPPAFPEWLQAQLANPRFYDPCATVEDWCPARPFFALPEGEGRSSRGWSA